MLYTKLEHRFVQYIPEQLDPGAIYISMDYATAAHSCCCGCGLQVITPFAPTDWKLTFDGETISLWPSIGNWNFPCRSHYIIRQSRVITAEPWEERQLEGDRGHDKDRKRKHYEQKGKCQERSSTESTNKLPEELGLLDRLKKGIRRKRR